MKHLKLFLNDIDYQNYVKSDDCIRPNVSYAEDTDTVYYNPYAESVSSYKMVDLGLPSGLKWADRNVGAASPEDAGLYFAWGETVGYTAEQIANGEKKFAHDWSDYFDTKDVVSVYQVTFNKYTVDKLAVLEAADDAAIVNMGADWRMPTIDELKELINNTTATFIDIDGNEFSQSEAQSGAIAYYNLKGVKLTSKTNSNSIFVPASSVCANGKLDDIGVGVGYCGYLWSSALNDPDGSLYASMTAKMMSFTADGSLRTVDRGNRYAGRSVRGVCN